MKKILVIKPGYRYSPSELEAMNERIKKTIKEYGFLLLSSIYDECEIVEIDDVVIGGR